MEVAEMLSEKEKQQVRSAILYYAVAHSKGHYWAPSELETAFSKLQGKDFEKKKKKVEETLTIADLGGLMLANLENIEHIVHT